jgi:chromate transport protein ChrA
VKKRPPLVILVSLVLIATGIGGLIQHNAEIRKAEFSGITIAVVEVVAITAGIFMLMRRNWARWLAMAWISFHVVMSFLHPWPKLVVHIVVFAVFALALFRRDARDHFEPPKPDDRSLAT